MADWPNLTIRPLTRPGTTPADARKRWAFTASWSATLELLDRELYMLDAHHGVLELDYAERDLRLDGYPRANAQMGSPAVAIAFECKYGPLRYDTDRFYYWQHNVRAIALSLEALRKVDRYGITKRGEQYTGWRAIANTAEDPRDVLTRHAFGAQPVGNIAGMTNEDLYKMALRRLHPDRPGGSADDFQAVQEARRSLAASGRWPQ